MSPHISPQSDTGVTHRLGYPHVGISEPPNQQGQEQSIINPVILVFKEEVVLLEICVGTTWVRNGPLSPHACTTHCCREPLYAVVLQQCDTEQQGRTSYGGENTVLLLHLPQTTV